MNFGIRGVIADVIIHAKFLVNQFRGFAISIGLAGRSYNSVSTAVLHCDKVEQEGLAVASIARDVGSSSTNRSSDIMHFLPRLLKKTLQHERL